MVEQGERFSSGSSTMCLEGEMKVQEVWRFWEPPRYTGSSRHQLCGRLSRGSLGFSPGADAGSGLNTAQKEKVVFLFLPPQLATWTGNGEATTHGSPMRVVYAAHAVYQALISCPCDVVLQTSALPPHPWGSCHSSVKRKRWRRRGSYELGLCCPNLFAVQCSYSTLKLSKNPAACHWLCHQRAGVYWLRKKVFLLHGSSRIVSLC